jgi:uncharacterized membrane protein YphA (DoxX/SURF4 family)
METIVKQGRLLFAIAIAALGAENFICAHVSQVVFENNPPGVPVLPFVPANAFLAYLVGIVLLAAGVSVVANMRPDFAETFLGLFFAVYTLVHLVPIVVGRPRDLSARTGVFEVLALSASALTLAAYLKQKRASEQRSLGGPPVTLEVKAINTLIASGPYLFAICSVVFGITHFLIPRVIASLVPGWIPGGLFWAYFTGTAFIAAGISIATGVLARWGAFWLGVMLLLWFLVLHAPRVAMHPRLPAEWSSMFEVLGMGGGSWICAWHLLQGRRHNTQ